MPTPTEVAIKALGPDAVELSFRVVVRTDGYWIAYDDDQPGEPYQGTGLRLLHWPSGCGDLDGGLDRTLAAAMATDASTDHKGSLEAGWLPDAAAPDAALDASAHKDLSASDLGHKDQSPSDKAILKDQTATDKAILKDQTATADAAWPGVTVASPIRIPAHFCLELEDTYSDAGKVPTSTPGRRPRVRLAGLRPGRTTYFTVRSYRGESQSPASAEVAFPAAVKASP